MTSHLYFKSNINETRFMSNVTTLPNGLKLSIQDIGPEMQLVCPGLRSYLTQQEGNTAEFITSEAVWQSLKSLNYKTFQRFTKDGDLGKLSISFFQLIHPTNPDKALKKYNSWSKKLGDGIPAKLAANPTYAKKLSLKPGVDINYKREHLAPSIEREIWLTLLRLKYTQNTALYTRLVMTKPKVLIELEPGAKKFAHWGGLMVNGEVVGANKMGQYMMVVRDE